MRVARREVAALLARGVAAPRIAVLYRDAAPYATLLREAFTAAGLPVDGPPARTLTQTPAGRALVGLLELDHDGWTRQGVADWLAAAPVRDARGPVPAARWDRVARRAGVVGGPDQWRRRLSDVAPDADPDAAARAAGLPRRPLAAPGRPRRPRLGRRGGLADRPARRRRRTGRRPPRLGAGRPGRRGCAARPRRRARRAGRHRRARRRAGRHHGPARAAGRAGWGRRPRRRPGGGVRVGPIDDAPFLDADHMLVVGMAGGIVPGPSPGTAAAARRAAPAAPRPPPGAGRGRGAGHRSDHVRRSRAALWGRCARPPRCSTPRSTAAAGGSASPPPLAAGAGGSRRGRGPPAAHR